MIHSLWNLLHFHCEKDSKYFIPQIFSLSQLKFLVQKVKLE